MIERQIAEQDDMFRQGAHREDFCHRLYEPFTRIEIGGDGGIRVDVRVGDQDGEILVKRGRGVARGTTERRRARQTDKAASVHLKVNLS